MNESVYFLNIQFHKLDNSPYFKDILTYHSIDECLPNFTQSTAIPKNPTLKII